MTLAVLELKEEGSLHKLYEKWWYEKGQCGFDSGGVSIRFSPTKQMYIARYKSSLPVSCKSNH